MKKGNTSPRRQFPALRGRGGRTAAASPRRLTGLPPLPGGSRPPAGEQAPVGKGTVPSALYEIQRGHINATTRRHGWRSPLCPPGETEARGSQPEHQGVTCGWQDTAAGHRGTGLAFKDLELCTQQLYVSLQAYFFLFFFLKKNPTNPADLCTGSVLLSQMEKRGLAHGNSQDMSFVCCFNLSLNFFTFIIDFIFSLLFLFLLEKPSRDFSCL